MQPRDSIPTSTGRVSRVSTLPFAYEEGSLTNRAAGSPTLAYQLSIPEHAKASVLVIHGYAEHGGRYRNFVASLAKRSIATAVVDLRGHGWSEGARGYCNRFAEYHDDVSDMLRVLKEHLSAPPLFAFGHSFGGLVMTTYALDHGSLFAGLVLSSPFFDVASPVSPAKRALGRLASRVFPKLSIPTGFSGRDVTHDETLARLYDNDPLVNKGATARWYTETVAAQRQLRNRKHELRMPVLVVQAGADRLASASVSRSVFDGFGSTDKRFDERTGLYHEVLNEPAASEAITAEIGDWILEHVAK